MTWPSYGCLLHTQQNISAHNLTCWSKVGLSTYVSFIYLFIQMSWRRGWRFLTEAGETLGCNKIKRFSHESWRFVFHKEERARNRECLLFGFISSYTAQTRKDLIFQKQIPWHDLAFSHRSLKTQAHLNHLSNFPALRTYSHGSNVNCRDRYTKLYYIILFIREIIVSFFPYEENVSWFYGSC